MTQSHVLCKTFFCSQVSKTTLNVLNCHVNLTNRFHVAARLFSSRSQLTTVVSVARTKKWRSEPCGLNVAISASCDCSVAIFTTSLKSQESYLALRNVTLQITRDFFRCTVLSHGSIMLPPHQPRVFARLARWQ